MSVNTSFHRLKVKAVQQETAECISIVFDIPDTLRPLFLYRPGQYLTLKTDIRGEEVRRSYSICSAPGDEALSVAVKHVEAGKFSGFANTVLKAGDELEVMPPLGKFSPHRDENGGYTGKNYLAFAAGSGITPVISILKDLLYNHPESTFTLVYGNKSRSSIIFKETLEALKNKFMNRLRIYHVFSREKMDAPLFNGRINEEKAKAFCDQLIRLDHMDEVFICGPESMILDLRRYFIETRKLPAGRVHFELFSSPDQPRALNADWERKQQAIDPKQKSKVTVRLDGASVDLSLAYAGETILDAALQEGLDLPFACKGGVCCTCRAKLVEGEVDMEVNYGLEPDEIENNFILTCQAHPRSEKVVVDFDVK